MTPKRAGRSATAIGALKILPDVNVVAVGAASILEQGRDVAMALTREIAEATTAQHKVLVTVGGGRRHRHIFTIATDLKMPVGVLSVLGQNTPHQNALIMQALLAPYGGVRIEAASFDKIPVYIGSGCIPITGGMPTYSYWEHPPAVGELPPHDTDVGAYLLAETLGAKSCVFVKDVDGVYDADPKTSPNAKLFDFVTTAELRDVPTLPFDPPILELLDGARLLKEIRVVNGHVPGQLTAALEGKAAGTTVRAS